MATYMIGEMLFTTETKSKVISEELTQKQVGEICEYVLNIQFSEEVSPQRFSLVWEEKQVDILGVWNSKSNFWKNITPEWSMRRENSRTASGMPLIALYNQKGRNRVTVSLSDVANSCTLGVGVVEENGNLRFRIDFFDALTSRMKEYRVVIRIDRRSIPVCDAIQDVRTWWSELGYPCAYTPLAATMPMYSTWYNFHQNINTDAILSECYVAKQLGMDTVIVDDGWHTDDNSRGYAYCGEWQVCQSKIPNMKAFVDSVHELGMKFMIWFSVPFIGYYSKNYDRFKGMFLRDLPSMSASVLDPRFKEVRDFLTNTYCEAIREYGWDGLKLDFVDEFMLTEHSSTAYEKMDCVSVEEGVRTLLQEVSQKIKDINPEFLIEFRQTYVGPSIGQYGNMFRVGDCPNDVLSNRIGSLNLRLTSGTVAVHSDPLMWHKDDTLEAVSQQFLSTMFSVPQISVRLSDLPYEHKKYMSAHLTYWRSHKDTLLNGKIDVYGMEANYTMASAKKDDERISVFYQNVVAVVGEDIVHDLWNATGLDMICLECKMSCLFEIYDMFGNQVSTGSIEKGVCRIDVPIGGRIKLMQI